MKMRKNPDMPNISKNGLTMNALKFIPLFVLAIVLGIGHQPDALAETDAAAVQAVPSEETVFLPRGDLFKPLLADPKEPRFYASYRLFKYRSEDIHALVGGYGEIFGLYRHIDNSGVQLAGELRRRYPCLVRSGCSIVRAGIPIIRSVSRSAFEGGYLVPILPVPSELTWR
jgi:hypothetical protein